MVINANHRNDWASLFKPQSAYVLFESYSTIHDTFDYLRTFKTPTGTS